MGISRLGFAVGNWLDCRVYRYVTVPYMGDSPVVVSELFEPSADRLRAIRWRITDQLQANSQENETW